MQMIWCEVKRDNFLKTLIRATMGPGPYVSYPPSAGGPIRSAAAADQNKYSRAPMATLGIIILYCPSHPIPPSTSIGRRNIYCLLINNRTNCAKVPHSLALNLHYKQ